MKNKSIAIICMLMILMIVSTVSAGLIFKQNSEINYRFRCLDENNNYCNSSTLVAISVEYPNGSSALDNKSMSYAPTYFNVTLPTDALGTYNALIISPTINGTTSEFLYLVTPSGTEQSITQGIIYFIFFIVAFIIFFLTLYYAINIPWQHQRDDEGYIISVNDLRWVKVLCIGLCYILLMSIMGLMKAVTSNFIPELGLDKMFEWIYWLMLSFLYPIIVCSLVFALIIFLTDKKIVKALERGIPTQ